MRLASSILLALSLAAPASAHLLQRGVPLSELAATSPVAVIGRVASASGAEVELQVEEALLGSAPDGLLRFRSESHHLPRYTAGSRVLVFLARAEPPWISRQTALDRLELPAADAEREALLAAVRGYAGLRTASDRAEQLARLKALSLAHLESASPRVRHEALLDLVAIAARASFAASEIAWLAELAGRQETPDTLAPGLVVLLAAIRLPEADRALFALLADGKNPRARARAAEVIGRRHGARAEAALRGALDDPALVVRATAQHALARIETGGPPRQLALESKSSNPPEGKQDAVPQADQD